MEQALEVLAKLPEYTDAVVGVLGAVIVLCMLIPGEQPEKTLQKVVDFIKKLSRK